MIHYEKIRAACDIDGILADFDWCFRQSLYSVLGIDKRHTTASVWSLQQSYGITAEQEREVWESDDIQTFMTLAPVLPFARNVTDSLLPGSFYVTARGSNLEFDNAVDFRCLTIRWLKSNGFPDFPVVFTNDKVEFTTDWDIEYAIDDCPMHIQCYINSGVTVFSPKYEYNSYCFDSDTPLLIPILEDPCLTSCTS
jgi:hypothetical protein